MNPSTSQTHLNIRSQIRLRDWLSALVSRFTANWRRRFAVARPEDWASFESHKDTERVAKLLGFTRDELVEAVQQEGWAKTSQFLRNRADEAQWQRPAAEHKPAGEKAGTTTAAKGWLQ
jgi:hypothetical protein